MSKEKSSTTTRREFLGAATVTAAALATPTLGQAKEMSGAQEQLPEFRVAQASTETSSAATSNTAKEGDWSKPRAMAIPKGGYVGKPEQGRYGPIFPKTPACYGFSIIAKLIPGREEACYKHAKTIEEAIAKDPNYLAVLKLHYLRWQLFEINGETYFQYQGIFDTDFDKYTEDAVALFSAGGIDTVFENLEGFPKDWKTRPAGFIEFVRDHHRPSFLEYGEYPYVSADEIKKALRVKSALSGMLDQMQ
jgi:hypothetical protein